MYLTMDRKVKRDWVAALRSGQYTQGSGRLLRYDGETPKYCCLGVLCEVVGVQPDASNFFLGAKSTLPSLVYRGVGLPNENPTLLVGSTRASRSKQGMTLADLNDSGFTFPQIADLIEHFIRGEW